MTLTYSAAQLPYPRQRREETIAKHRNLNAACSGADSNDESGVNSSALGNIAGDWPKSRDLCLKRGSLRPLLTILNRAATSFWENPICDLLTLTDDKITQVALDGFENLLKVSEADKTSRTAASRWRGGQGAERQCQPVRALRRGGMVAIHNLKHHENLGSA
ncbi:Importin subunit alpha-1 [Rhodotorula toruloides]